MNFLQVGKGKGRDYEAVEKFIHNLPYVNGRRVTVAAVAKMANVPPQIAYDTVKGRKNSAKVLQVLQELGVPKQYLFGDANYDFDTSS